MSRSIFFAVMIAASILPELCLSANPPSLHQNRDGSDELGSVFSAVKDGNLEKIRNLIVRHPDLVNTSDRRLGTPLHQAVAYNDVQAIRLLLSHGAKVDAFWGGNTPLHLAAAHNLTDVAKLLLANSADINARGRIEKPEYNFTWTGPSPLDTAARRGYLEMVRLLLKHGAKLRGEGQPSPLHLACSGSYDKEYCKRIKSPGNRKIIEFLIGEGLSINEPDPKGWTPLMIAADAAAYETVRYLVTEQSDVKINYQAKPWKLTALIAAADGHYSDDELEANQVKIVEVLLKNGADPLLERVDGKNVYEVKKYNIEVLRILEEHRREGMDDNP